MGGAGKVVDSISDCYCNLYSFSRLSAWSETMDRARTEAIIRGAYDARDSGDIDAVMRFFAPDATFELVGSAATFPAAMRVRGEAGLRKPLAG
jgi:hypothetical protein